MADGITNILGLEEKPAVRQFRQLYGGMDFGFREAFAPGLNRIVMTSPKDINGDFEELTINTKNPSESEIKIAQDFISKYKGNKSKTQTFDVDTYEGAWTFADTYKNETFLDENDAPISVENLDYDQLKEHVDLVVNSATESNEYIANYQQTIKDGLKDFEAKLLSELKTKYDLTSQENVDKANKEYKSRMSVAYDDFVKNDDKYKSVVNSINSAVYSRFGGDLKRKFDKKNVKELYPEWMENSDFLKGVYKNVMYEMPNYKEQFRGLKNADQIEIIQKEIDELKTKDPNSKVSVAGTFKLGSPEKTTVAGISTVSERIEQLEKQKIVYQEDLMQNFAQTKKYQDEILSKLTPPEMFDENGNLDLTLDEFQEIGGTQAVNMAAAVLTMGGYTYVIESASAFNDIVTNKAAMKFMLNPIGPMGNVVERTAEQKDLISKMDGGQKLKFAMESFNKLPAAQQIDLKLDIVNKGEGDLHKAHTVGGVNAGFDIIGNAFILFKGVKFIPKQFAFQITKGLYKKALKTIGGSLGVDAAQGTGLEVLTETMQEVTQAAALETSTNTYEGLGSFFSKNKKKFMEAGGQAALLPGPTIAVSQTASTTISSINNFIKGYTDPNATINIINKAKKEINNQFEQRIKNTSDKKEINDLLNKQDEILTNLYNNEEIINNTKYKNLDAAGKTVVLSNLNQIAKNNKNIKSKEEKVKKLKQDSVLNEAMGGVNSDLIAAEIELNELKQANKEVQIKNIQEILKNDYHASGVGLAQWVNNQNEGLFKDKSVVTFDKLEDALSFIESNNLTFKTAAAKKSLQNLKNGLSNGINYDNAIGIIVKENIDNNISRGDFSGGNTVHHEVLHFITDQYSAAELNNFAQAALTEIKNSADPKMQMVKALVDAKLKAYKGKPKKIQYEETLTAISDGLRFIKSSDINLENGGTLMKIGGFLGNMFKGNSSPNFDYTALNVENTLEFLKKYNDFNGKTNDVVSVVKLKSTDSNIDPDETVKESLGASLNEAYDPELKQLEKLLELLKGQAVIEATKPRGLKKEKPAFNKIPNFSVDAYVKALLNDPNRGALNLIMNFNTDANGNAISKGDPRFNDDFGGYAIAYLQKRAQEPSILAQAISEANIDRGSTEADFSKIEGGMSSEQITDQQQRAEQEINSMQPRLMDNLPIKNKVGETTYESIVLDLLPKILLTASKEIDQGKSKNKKGSDLVSELKNKLGDLLQDKTIDWMGRDGKVFQQFLIDNKNSILKGMTTTYLSRNFPRAIQKSVGGKKVFNETNKTIVKDGKEFKPGKIMNFIPNYVNEWQGKKVDKEIAAIHGRTAQHQIIKRHPNIGARITTNEWLKFFTKTTASGTITAIQSRREGVSYQIGGELGLEILQDDFRMMDNDGNFIGPIRKQYENKVSIINNINNDALINELAKDIERGTVKESIAITSATDEHLNEFYDGLQEFLNAMAESGFNVKSVFNKIYSKDIFGKQREVAINDLQKYFDQYKDVSQLYEVANVKMEQTLEEFITNQVEVNSLPANLRQMLGLGKGSIDFRNENQLIKAREAVVKIAHEIGFDKARRFLTFMYSSGFIGGTFLVNDGKGGLVEDKAYFDLKRLGKQGKLPKGKQDLRYGLFENADDFAMYVLAGLEGNNVIQNINTKQVSFGDKNVIESTVSQEVTKMNKFDAKADAASAKRNADFLIELAEVINKLDIDKNSIGMISMTLAGSMKTPLAAAAKVAYTVDGFKSTSKHIYEHVIPRRIAGLYFVQYAIDKTTRKDFKNLLEQYVVAVVPRDQAKIFDKFYQSSMPAGWKIGDDVLIRYFNINTFGKINLNLLDSVTGKPVKIAQTYTTATNMFVENLDDNLILADAIKTARVVIKESRGITILDFDDTLATSNSKIRFITPQGEKGSLTPAEYASTYESLLGLGYKFDFSEFNEVVDGKIAPLFQKALKLQGKFGPENMFVLTARPAESAPAIFTFLQANGLKIPLKNITGLANSTSEAKALWIAGKVAEGFNDFYFADDALQNVQAVKNMLDQFDVKSKIQQARVKESISVSDDFNDILENVTGIESKKRFSAIKARKRGAGKGKFRIFIPPSHEDFVGLLYNFMGRGELGDQHRNFYEKHLVNPLNRAYKEYDIAKQSIANDYKALNKNFKDTKKKLTKKTPDGDFTYEDAVRVYIWDKHGYKVPGLTPTDQKKLSGIVKKDPELLVYAESINKISKLKKYIDPLESWSSGDIRTDLNDATDRVGRGEFFKEFFDNANLIFSVENLNKIEAGFGKGMRESLGDMLYRISTGRNRPKGQNETVNRFVNYLNGSVGTVMFFNTRSAILQQMSNVNYLNFSDNNIYAAGKAFANQKQYWADFAFIFNSDMLKQRRGGIQTDINGAELFQAIDKSNYPIRSAITKLLQLGFLPTQIGDNIAIATGGATFYRNRINTYLKQGLSKAKAEAKAFTDFQNITQSTQQSARPDMVSKQQAGIAGKIILNFQNVTSQYNRIIKKSALDIINRRKTPPYKNQFQSDMSNLSRIIYFGGAQNLIFYGLQSALYMMLFDEDESEEKEKFYDKKKQRVLHGSIDSVLRGSGIYGAAISTLKNMIIKYKEQRAIEKYGQDDQSAVLMEFLNFSPVIGIKARKVVNAEKTLTYNKKAISEMETFDFNNPIWSASTSYIEGLFNIPLNKTYTKVENIRGAMSDKHSSLERWSMFSGYSPYSLGIKNEEVEMAKQRAKGKSKSSGGGVIAPL